MDGNTEELADVERVLGCKEVVVLYGNVVELVWVENVVYENDVVEETVVDVHVVDTKVVDTKVLDTIFDEVI